MSNFEIPYVFEATAGQATLTQQGESVVYTGDVDYTYDLTAPAQLMCEVFSFTEGTDSTNTTVTADRAALGTFLTAALSSSEITGGAVGQMTGDLQAIINGLISAWITSAQEYGRDVSQVTVTPAALAAAVQNVLSPDGSAVTPAIAQVLQRMYEQAIGDDPDRVATGTAFDSGSAVDTPKIRYRTSDVIDLLFRISFQETPVTVASPSNVDLIDPRFTVTANGIANPIPSMPAHSGVVVRFRITLYDTAMRSLPANSDTMLYNVLKPGEQLIDPVANSALRYLADGNVNLINLATDAVLWSSGVAAPGGTTAAYLILKSDGDLQAVSSAGTPYWSSNTGGGTASQYTGTVSGMTFAVSDGTASIFSKP